MAEKKKYVGILAAFARRIGVGTKIPDNPYTIELTDEERVKVIQAMTEHRRANAEKRRKERAAKEAEEKVTASELGAQLAEIRETLAALTKTRVTSPVEVRSAPQEEAYPTATEEPPVEAVESGVALGSSSWSRKTWPKGFAPVEFLKGRAELHRKRQEERTKAYRLLVDFIRRRKGDITSSEAAALFRSSGMPYPAMFYMRARDEAGVSLQKPQVRYEVRDLMSVEKDWQNFLAGIPAEERPFHVDSLQTSAFAKNSQIYAPRAEAARVAPEPTKVQGRAFNDSEVEIGSLWQSIHDEGDPRRGGKKRVLEIVDVMEDEVRVYIVGGKKRNQTIDYKTLKRDWQRMS